jgi:hypothetical protein
MRLRKLVQFRLRTLLFFMAVVAVIAGGIRRAVDQYHVEQETLRQLSDYRFPITAKVRRPWWIPAIIDERFARVFDRVVQVSIAGPTLDWDRGLSLNARSFRDEHLRILTHFRNLERLDLTLTSVTAESVDALVDIRSLKALDVSGTEIGAAGIREFQERRPDCFVCNSQPTIFAYLESDQTITIGDERGQLRDAKRILTEARRGPDAFGHVPMLEIFAEEGLVRRRAQMIRTVRQAALDAGYQSVQIIGR